MSATTTGLALGRNGLPNPPSAHVQADFYAKLARLKQDIVAGRHPRHTFPPQIIAQFGLATTESFQGTQYPKDRAPLPNGTAVQTSPIHQQPQLPNIALPKLSGATSLPPPPNSRALPSKPSAIDPVLLTKSYDLVKAENHLKRLRIEKHLKEEAQSKKSRSGEKDNSGWNGAHTFDCVDVLNAALSRVKPISGLHTATDNADRPTSSTPNTNSYYSSQAWSPDHEKDQRREFEAGGDNSIHASYEEAGVGPAYRQPRVSGLGPSRTNGMADVLREDSYSPPNAGFLPPANYRVRESESYSPPPAAPGYNPPTHPDPQYSYNVHHLAGGANVRKGQTVSTGRQNQREKRERKAAKAATRSQNDTVAPAPAPPAPRPNERKRKRDNEAPRPATGMVTRADSPLPYIKPEPVSPPPPFAQSLTDAPRRLVLRDDGTADIQVDAPPPATRRRVARDESDLRRVASMQYARNSTSPRFQRQQRPADVFYEPDVPPPRPASQQVSTRPRYYSTDEPPLASPNVYRQRRSPPVLLQDGYSPGGMMPPPAPPKRRIVVDQYGNEYIAVPASSSMRQSVAVEPEYLDSPQFDRPPVFDQPQPRHQQPIYAPSPRHIARPPPEVIELDDEDERQMPPPSLRLAPRRQRVVSDDVYMQPRPVYYDTQPQLMSSQRAVSMQPFRTVNQQHYKSAPLASPYVPQQPPQQQQHHQQHNRHQPHQQMLPMYERAVSARPNLARSGGYGVDYNYGGQYAPREDFRIM